MSEDDKKPGKRIGITDIYELSQDERAEAVNRQKLKKAYTTYQKMKASNRDLLALRFWFDCLDNNTLPVSQPYQSYSLLFSFDERIEHAGLLYSFDYWNTYKAFTVPVPIEAFEESVRTLNE